MKRGIEMSWAYDYKGRLALRIEKKRGKLTLAEIQDLIMYEERQRYCGHYAIILNCSEAATGGDDLYLEDGQKGDTVALYQIEEGETCPVCAEKSPPFEYCPSCGTAWKDMDQNVEKLIAAMRAEAERAIRSENDNQTWDGRLAWYWSYIGALDMPRKVLATIVEHAGMIPGDNEPTKIMKDLNPQLVIPEDANAEMNNWRIGERGDDVDLVPVIMQGFQIFQAQSLACWGIPLSYLGMVERDAAEHDGAIVVDDCRLLWDDGGEAIAVEAVRKAKSGWAKAWERAVWEALEGVDLHKEEDT